MPLCAAAEEEESIQQCIAPVHHETATPSKIKYKLETL